jgi:hypothetical protein
MGYTGMVNLGKHECRPIDVEPGAGFWVFSQVEWRADSSGAARWIGSDRREICDEFRLQLAYERQPASDCARVRVK